MTSNQRDAAFGLAFVVVFFAFITLAALSDRAPEAPPTPEPMSEWVDDDGQRVTATGRVYWDGNWTVIERGGRLGVRHWTELHPTE